MGESGPLRARGGLRRSHGKTIQESPACVNTVREMEQRLQALAPENIEILDESGKHAGHEGAKGGGGHYDLFIVSPRFAGRPLLPATAWCTKRSAI